MAQNGAFFHRFLYYPYSSEPDIPVGDGLTQV